MRVIRSAIVIAQLLGCEGFTDHTAAEVKRYWMRNRCHPKRYARIQRVKKAFSELVKAKLNDGDRIILGKMMSIMVKSNFDTGLSIGLTTSLYTGDVEKVDDLRQGEIE